MGRLRRGYRQMFASEISEEELDWMVAETKGNTPDQSVTLGTDYRAQDWRPLLPSIGLPVLIITGRQSGAYPGCLYIAETIPNARLVTCEQSGHAPFYDEPEKFNATIAEFVDNA